MRHKTYQKHLSSSGLTKISTFWHTDWQCHQDRLLYSLNWCVGTNKSLLHMVLVKCVGSSQLSAELFYFFSGVFTELAWSIFMISTTIFLSGCCDRARWFRLRPTAEYSEIIKELPSIFSLNSQLACHSGLRDKSVTSACACTPASNQIPKSALGVWFLFL